METSRRADGAMMYTAPGGQLQIWHPAPGVIATVFAGDLAECFYEPLAEAASHPLHIGHRLVIFHDWEAMENYHTATRNKLTQLGTQLRDRIENTHVLLRSRVVVLGVQVANLVLKNLVAYSSRATFEAARTVAVASRTAALRTGA